MTGSHLSAASSFGMPLPAWPNCATSASRNPTAVNISGSALVRKAVETARSTGARWVVLEVRPGDRAIDANALVSMYQKLGFRASGRSAAGNTVMQRATGTEAPFLPSASSSKGGRSRTVQGMDANIHRGPKPSFEDYIGWLNQQKRTREQAQSLSTRLTLARDPNSVHPGEAAPWCGEHSRAEYCI